MSEDYAARHADIAERFLNESAEGLGSTAHSAALGQARAMIGAGYAMLAASERLATVAGHLADANDVATETRDQLAEIAMAVGGPAREPRGSRMPGAFGRLARRARPWSARKAGVPAPDEPVFVLMVDEVARDEDCAGTLVRGISGPGKNAALVRYAGQWLREHPGGVVSVHDPKDVSGDVLADAHARQDAAADVPVAAHAGQVVLLDVLRRSRDVVVLDGADVVTVRQALADAAVWRAWKAEGAGGADCARLDPGRCAGHAADDVQFAAYEALRDRMAGGAL